MDSNELQSYFSERRPDQIKKQTQSSESKYNEQSKDRLLKISTKKIDTTMIGAISCVEDMLRDLEHEMGEETALRLREHFEAARSRILDNGNNQKRNLAEEFKQYTIHWDRYTMSMPVKPRG